MNDVMPAYQKLPAMTVEDVAKVRMLETMLQGLPQLQLDTQHIIHGGLYSRTIMMPAGSALTGALLKIPTTVIVCGKATVFIGDKALELEGYTVLPASAGRKQAFYAHTETYITMLCATSAQSVDEIEQEMTDEFENLCSRNDINNNLITITGE